ncbi:flippase [Vibrio cyclitrophicus]
MRNSILYGGERVLFLLIGIVSNALIARSLTIEDFGLLNTAYSAVGLLGFLFGMGVELSLIKLIIKDKTDALTCVAAGTLIRLLGSMFAIILFFIVINGRENSTLVEASAFLIIASILNSFALLDCVFQANNDGKSSSFSKLFSRVVALLFQMSVAYISPDLVLFAMSNLVMTISLLLSQLYLIRNYNLARINNSKLKNYTSNLYKKSWPIALSSVAVSVLLQSDILILSILRSSEEVGIYSSVTRLLIPAGFVAYAISQAYYPSLIKKKESRKDYENQLVNLMTILLAVSLLGVVFINLLSSEILTLLYGVKYSEASNVFNVLSFTLILTYYGASSSKALIIDNYHMHELYKNVIAAVINVLLNLYLIEKMGITGAALSSIIALSLANCFYFLLIKKLRYIFKAQVKSVCRLVLLKIDGQN